MKIFFFTISITDQIIETNPNQYQEAIELVSELDWVKCDGIVLKVNSLTGNIEKIINHEEIINKWCEHKKKLENKYAFIRNPKGSDGIKKFIQTAEQQIVNEKTLLEDLETKMFFDIFFNKYLVNAKDKMDAFTRNFYSQLFIGEKIELKINQNLLRESEDKILIRKVSSINDTLRKSAKFADMYDERYKPILQYKFSEYNASLRERVVYDENLNVPEEGEVTIIEEIKNNIQLLVSYNFRKIE